LDTKVVAVSDRNVTLYNGDGLDIKALIEFTSNHEGDLPTTEEALSEHEIKADIQEREDVLYLDTDVLILAALEDQIHEDNVDQVKARMIVEGA
ncbi:glutamate dehydrogenase, partial [Micrococcus sp. SIMBA_131]